MSPSEKKPVRARATAENVTPDLINKQFVARLYALAKVFSDEASLLAGAIKEDKLGGRDYIPLVIQGALDKMDDLELFCNNTLAGKRRSAEKGKIRFRGEYLEKKRANYRKEKQSR